MSSAVPLQLSVPDLSKSSRQAYFGEFSKGSGTGSYSFDLRDPQALPDLVGVLEAFEDRKGLKDLGRFRAMARAVCASPSMCLYEPPDVLSLSCFKNGKYTHGNYHTRVVQATSED